MKRDAARRHQPRLEILGRDGSLSASAGTDASGHSSAPDPSRIPAPPVQGGVPWAGERPKTGPLTAASVRFYALVRLLYGGLLVLALSLAAPPPAQAQVACEPSNPNEVWCATMTVGEWDSAGHPVSGFTKPGFPHHSGVDGADGAGSLSDNAFTYGGQRYEVEYIEHDPQP